MNIGEIIIYQTSDGSIALDVRLEKDTIWLTQKQISELFGTKWPAIAKHLKNIFSSGELEESSTCSILEHMGNDGKQRYQTNVKQNIKVLADILDHKTLEYSEATGLLRVITDYTYALDTFDKYDYRQLEIDRTTSKEQFKATYDNAMEAINELRGKFGGSSLSDNEKDRSFKGSIVAIYQTFDGQDLYPSIELIRQ